jgi:hypothetical protein
VYRSTLSLSLVALLLGLPACNVLTGADDLDVAGAGGDGGGDGTPAPKPLVEAAGVTINEIAIYQAVKRPLMAGGVKAASDTPVVSGRAALIRVFYATDASYDGKPITARLRLGETGDPVDVTATLAGTSTEADLESTINFELPAGFIKDDFQYSVMVGQAPGGAQGTGAATYPASGLEVVGATSVGASLKIELVPVHYVYGGADILPDTSEEQLALYADGFRAMYPAPKVEVTVHAPLEWNRAITPMGGGWDTILNEVTQLRLDEGVPEDVYFYGIFNPETSFGKFCGGGCVLGLGNLGGPHDNYSRAAVGLGYPGQDSVETALHEIGHTHGRQHAPCDTWDSDPGYPYSDGSDGVWGYNLVTKRLYSPETPDIMGYCYPMWISDYTFGALIDRMRTVNNAKVTYPAETLDRTYDRVHVLPRGGAEWLEPVKLRTPPIADPTTVTVWSSRGDATTLTGAYFPYDHLNGGVLLVPRGAVPIHKLRVDVEARTVEIAR